MRGLVSVVRYSTFFAALRRAEVAEALLASNKERYETLLQDLRASESERRALVDKIGLVASQGPLNKYLLDTDPFAEQANRPDEFLTPPEEEVVDARGIEQALNEPRPTTGDGTI